MTQAASSTQDEERSVPSPGGRPNPIRRFLNVLGPGLVTGAADDDPPGVATYAQAGATFSNAMLWTVPVTLPLMMAEERIFSGVGFGVAAIGPMWRVIKTSSGLRPAAIRVAGEIEIAEIEEFFAKIVKTNRVRGYKTLTGAITKFEVDIFEKKAAKFLVDDGRSLVGVGDDGVREVVGIPKHSSPGGSEGAAPDFVSISSGHQLIVSEAKGGKIPVSKVRKQLTNAMKALKEKGLDGDVARYELIMEQGAKFLGAPPRRHLRARR